MGVPYAEVIGDPIAHSKSPLIHKFWLEKLGLDCDFRRTRVGGDGLAAFLEERSDDPDWRGCNVTIPHKTAIAAMLDDLAGPAKMIGAVNCVIRKGGAREPRLIGHNTDISGFLEPLQPWLDRDFKHRSASVVGTGGAAAAVSYALSQRGFLVVSYARDAKRAGDFRRRIGLDEDSDFACDIDDLSRPGTDDRRDRADILDLLVNATPLGMEGFPPLRVNLKGSPPGMVVYDLVYAPLETPLLRDARALGLPTIDGLQMLVGQAASAFEMFFEENPPREYDAELRELLTR